MSKNAEFGKKKHKEFKGLSFREEWLWSHNFWTINKLVVNFQRVLSPTPTSATRWGHDHHPQNQSMM
jgi:hypothetical protein